ncbi:MAG: aminotransferase class I/II-fold pyridoxal phosphate-dependent enzyme, partial [Leptospiraceae bacterium]|nr:aminotransferase class I/II-fold pyridoxal phosphate-dependent enzyme [Leptospiraceae bacterium]
ITGEYIPRERLRHTIAASQKLWVVDEAYNDFAGADATMLPYVGEHPNLIVTRTFSKTHALAGLRVGYLVCSNALLLEGLLAHKDSYNEDALAVRLAVAALEDAEWHQKILTTVAQGLHTLRRELSALGFTVYDSAANYFLAEPPAGKTAATVASELRAHKILVRHYPDSPFADCVRISVGSPEENARLISALQQILGIAA